MHKDYNCAMNVTKTAVDDPDVAFYENHVCGAACNYTGYRNRNAEVDKLIDKQSAGAGHPETQKDCVGNRAQADRGRRPSDPALHPRHELPRAITSRVRQRWSIAFTNSSKFKDLWVAN
jgi:hypothetical protein